MGRACSTHGSDGECIQNFGGKIRMKRPLERLKCRWDDVKIELGEIGFGDIHWIPLAKDKDQWRALVNTVFNILAP
jgi:hypothetical protein